MESVVTFSIVAIILIALAGVIFHEDAPPEPYEEYPWDSDEESWWDDDTKVNNSGY